MAERKGSISVQTSDIFPIIKKWLYSEHDIFLRELVANATDAITKRATIARTANQEIPEGKINVTVSKDAKTIVISDNGIGMSETEVEKYIAQLAFSGAEEFIKKMKDSGDQADGDIIGKFGLGFYSSFMVSDKVEINSLSMEDGATPVRWTCEGDTEYTFSESDRTEVGTSITLHINKESEEFLESYKTAETLKNFCDFMPYPIEVLDLEKFEQNQKDLAEQAKKDAAGEKSEDENAQRVEPLALNVVNDTEPLWKKDPSTLKDDDYLSFFKKMFPMEQEPLFWIHLKVDHPFTLEGILYFPKLNPNKSFNESNIRLYSKQVFVSNNVKNIIPDFLSLLKGAIDSTDIPLNVSRSSLQGDPNIKRISNYIVKKVAESLKKLFKNDREKFEAIWEDIALFIKYGVISETKFDDLMRNMVLFKNSDEKFITLNEYKESVPETYKDKMGDKVLYFEKEKSDWSLRKQLKQEGVQAIETDDHIDPHFMQHIETNKKDDKSFSFNSIDSEIANILATDNTDENDIKVKELFQKILVGKIDSEETKEEENSNDLNSMEVEIQKIKNSSTPAYFKVDEQMKRFQKMAQSMGQNQVFPVKKTLVLNPGNGLIKNALSLSEKGNDKLVNKICHYVKDLANISSEGLDKEEKDNFVQRSQELMQELTDMAIN